MSNNTSLLLYINTFVLLCGPVWFHLPRKYKSGQGGLTKHFVQSCPQTFAYLACELPRALSLNNFLYISTIPSPISCLLGESVTCRCAVFMLHRYRDPNNTLRYAGGGAGSLQPICQGSPQIPLPHGLISVGCVSLVSRIRLQAPAGRSLYLPFNIHSQLLGEAQEVPVMSLVVRGRG